MSVFDHIMAKIVVFVSLNWGWGKEEDRGLRAPDAEPVIGDR